MFKSKYCHFVHLFIGIFMHTLYRTSAGIVQFTETCIPFEEHFPSESAARCVPSVPSVACSTAEALKWDASFRKLNDPSGRAVRGVHENAYK